MNHPRTSTACFLFLVCISLLLVVEITPAEVLDLSRDDSEQYLDISSSSMITVRTPWLAERNLRKSYSINGSTSAVINPDVVDGLDSGVSVHVISFFDESGNYENISINVQVANTTAPRVSAPLDIEYDEGSIGHSITWIVSGIYPASYQIHRNDLLVQTGNLISTIHIININVDGLTSGVHVYQILLTDSSGNTYSDEVVVVVNLNPYTLHVFVLMASIGLVAVVTIVTIRYKKKNAHQLSSGGPETEESLPTPIPVSEEIARALIDERESISKRVREESERRMTELDG